MLAIQLLGAKAAGQRVGEEVKVDCTPVHRQARVVGVGCYCLQGLGKYLVLQPVRQLGQQLPEQLVSCSSQSEPVSWHQLRACSTTAPSWGSLADAHGLFICTFMTWRIQAAGIVDSNGVGILARLVFPAHPVQTHFCPGHTFQFAAARVKPTADARRDHLTCQKSTKLCHE